MANQDRKNLNIKRRREALREDLKSREYIRQLHNLLDKDWEDKVPEMNGKVRVLEILLKKTLPDLKAIEHSADADNPPTFQLVTYAKDGGSS